MPTKNSWPKVPNIYLYCTSLLSMNIVINAFVKCEVFKVLKEKLMREMRTRTREVRNGDWEASTTANVGQELVLDKKKDCPTMQPQK